MKLFIVYAEGVHSDQYATLVVQANSTERAREVAVEHMREFPEFSDENATFDVRELLIDGGTEHVVWMS